MTTQQAFALALQQHQAGRLAEAEALYRQILAVEPRHAEARHFLGVVAHQVGRDDLAVELIREALVLNPGNSAAHSNLGEAYRQAGRLEEAVASYRRALELKPDDPEAWYNLGNALRERGELDQALAAYQRALALKSGDPDIHNNLGLALAGQGRCAEAIAAYRRALQLNPDYAEAHGNLGNAFKEQGQFDAAIASYRRMLQFKPDAPDIHTNLGDALQGRGQLDEAVAAHGHALKIKPDYAPAYNNLGNAFKDRGQLDEALREYRRALEIKPDSAEAHSNLIYTLHLHPNESRSTIAAEQQRWNRQFGGPLKRPAPSHDNDRSPNRRLRIGYVSPDFRDHALGRNLVPLFRGHDPQNFEIVCYSGVAHPDRFTEEFRRRASQWRSSVGVTDDALAAMIRKDGIDVLVDISLHTGGNRLPVFTRQPAPVQVSFAGYPTSTGLETIPYRISDRYLESEIGDRRSEIGVDLPSPNFDLRPAERVFLLESFWCYDPHGVALEVNSLPAQERGRVSFGSLNNFCKINEPVLKLWARVLRKVTGSRLLLLSPAGSHRQRTLDILQCEGIEAWRVEFVEPRGRQAYLELYHQLDIALDPFPYNGHTTSLDALWMGVPVVSLAGQCAVSRGGLSQLSNLGFAELIAYSEDEYARIAAELAGDFSRLAALRRALRPRMQASLLMDAPRFARNIETAYRTLWRHWCAEQQGRPR